MGKSDVKNRSRVIAEFEKNKGIMSPIYANVINRCGLIGANRNQIENFVMDICDAKLTPIGYFAAIRKKDGGINVTMSKCRVCDYFEGLSTDYGRHLARLYAVRGTGIPEHQINDNMIEASENYIYMFNTGAGTVNDQYKRFIHRVCSYYKDAKIKIALE